ncbi:MAG: hypothetical protein QNJ94_24135 [Alphaproteobacteria bacterium]|nr:hypothetical protein [Alphaproteobacteria bacterium]
MGGLFSTPDLPAPAPPAPLPTPEDPEVQRRRREERQALRRRRGRGASILTSPLGDPAAPTTRRATLLGGGG